MLTQGSESRIKRTTEREEPKVSQLGPQDASSEHPKLLIHIPNNRNELPNIYSVTDRSQRLFLNTARYEWQEEDDSIVWQDYFTHDLWILVDPAHLETAAHLYIDQKLLTYDIKVVHYVSTEEEYILWSANYVGETKMSVLLLALQEHYGTTYKEVQDTVRTDLWAVDSARYTVVIRDVEFLVYVELVP